MMKSTTPRALCAGVSIGAVIGLPSAADAERWRRPRGRSTDQPVRCGDCRHHAVARCGPGDTQHARLRALRTRARRSLDSL